MTLEEGPEEVCLIDTILEEQAEHQQLQDVQIEKLAYFHEELQEAQELCVVHGPWRKKEEIFPLLTEEKTIEPQKLDLKPLPVELKYAYLEEEDQCSVVISSLLNTSQENSLLDVLKKNK